MSLMQLEAREPALTPLDSPKCFAFLLCTGRICDYFSAKREKQPVCPLSFRQPFGSVGAKNNKRAQHELKIRFLSHFVLLRLCWLAYVCGVCMCVTECVCLRVCVCVCVCEYLS